jgi:hypothetical protein
MLRILDGDTSELRLHSVSFPLRVSREGSLISAIPGDPHDSNIDLQPVTMLYVLEGKVDTVCSYYDAIDPPSEVVYLVRSRLPTFRLTGWVYLGESRQ